MNTFTTRPLSEEERAKLRPFDSVEWWELTAIGLLILLPIVTVYVALTTFWHVKYFDEAPGIIPLVLAPSIIVCTAMYLRKRQMSLLHPDLVKGTAKIKTYVATQAIEQIFDGTDEGMGKEAGFYLDIGEGSVLFLSGYYLNSLYERNHFPCTHFTITRTTGTNTLLDIKPEGTYLVPIYSNPPFTTDDLWDDIIPDDGKELSASFDSLKRTRPNKTIEATSGS